MTHPEIRGLALPPIRALLAEAGGITVHPDPYSAPFEAYHHHATGGTTWDLAALVEAAGPPPATVLDLGCGRGRLTLRLALTGHNVTAVDTSAAALAHLTGRLPGAPAPAGRVRVVDGDAIEPGVLPEKHFDVIVMGDMTINIFDTEDSVSALANRARELLAPGGVLCFPVLRQAALPVLMKRNGMTAVPYWDDSGIQRLMWLSLRHDPEGPYLFRTLFLQDVPGPDGALTGHATAARERLWTADTVLPLFKDCGLELLRRTPLDLTANARRPLPAELLILS
ncbi:class I SAM-dependent methyltransferase [Spirillospora sp. CA-255316]